MLRRVASRVPICRNLNHVPIDDHFFGLTDEEIEIRYSMRKFFETELTPEICKKVDEDDHYPEYRELFKKCGDMGLFGMTVPEEFGGTNLGIVAHGIAGIGFSDYLEKFIKHTR